MNLLSYWGRLFGASFKEGFRVPEMTGSAGETRVSATLRYILDPEHYVIMDDLTLPTDTGTTQIDHVVLSRYGIFVVETKNMSGWIFGSSDQAKWTQVHYGRKTRFQNPMRQNYQHVKVVQEVLGVELSALYNVVAFVGSAEPRTPMPANVVWGVKSLKDRIGFIRENLFSQAQVDEFKTALENAAKSRTQETRRAHVQSVKANLAARAASAPDCPRCGEQMRERVNRKTGDKFWGCARFPKCRGTKVFAQPDPVEE